MPHRKNLKVVIEFENNFSGACTHKYSILQWLSLNTVQVGIK